jgi:hypothetical protein
VLFGLKINHLATLPWSNSRLEKFKWLQCYHLTWGVQPDSTVELVKGGRPFSSGLSTLPPRHLNKSSQQSFISVMFPPHWRPG